ncbi:MAG: serpin family protein, partial [Ruminococcus sp.]|nr:serpin family protein [Ruminococcus sp.]
FDDYVSRFDAAELNKLLDSMDITKQSTAALPAFSVGSDKKAQPLSDILTKCGLYTLFGKDAAFSALSYTQSVKLGGLYELAPVFSLDRNGINTQTAAAAAQTEPAGLTVDRPFLFLLLDNESNLPVLVGSFFENRALN